MGTSNLVTSLQAQVTALGTLRTQLLFFINANAGIAGQGDSPSSVHVAQAKLMLAQVDTALQLFNERRFRAGAKLDQTLTTS